MSEYIDYYPIKHDASSGSPPHIDNHIGRHEYDPYPNKRSRQASWNSNGTPLSGPVTPGRTPGNTPSALMSPVPGVHRMDRDNDGGEQAWTPRRGPRSPPISSPRPALSGPSRFKEMDQPVDTPRWTSPTNVSFPASSVHGNIQHAPETLSLFAPRQVSTPAPMDGHPRDYRDNTPRYGAIDDEYPSRSEPQEYSGMDENEEDYDYGDDPDIDPEDMTVPLDDTPDDGEHPQGQVYTDVEPAKKKGRAKRFVGGFMMGLRNVPKMMSRGHAQEPPSAPPVPFAPQFSNPPQLPQLHRMQSSRLQPPPAHVEPLNPRRSRPSPQDHPAQVASSTHLEVTPAASIPQYAQEDSTQSSNTTATSQTGPITPEQTTDAPIDLPNPHDTPLDTSARIESPVQIELRPAADYTAMDQPIYDDAPETTFSTHVNRVGKFISDFTRLPWISSHVAVDYEPGESRRARYAGQKPGPSWYTKENHEKLDLLATPPMRQRAPPARAQASSRPGPSRPHRPRTPPLSPSSRDAATAVRPARTPRSITSGDARDLDSPGASSHGHGHHSYSYTYYYAPQPLYVYPSPHGSPVGHGPPDMPGLRLPSPSGREAPQAIPVYMLAAPPMMVPASPGGHHRHHASRQQPIQFPVPVVPLTTSPRPFNSPRHTRSPSPEKARAPS